MDFGEALKLLRNGFTLTRSDWNGSGQFVRFEPATKDLMAHFILRNAQGQNCVWVPSVGDLLAETWELQ